MLRYEGAVVYRGQVKRRQITEIYTAVGEFITNCELITKDKNQSGFIEY